MNLRFLHFCVDFTLLAALLAQCLALPSAPSPSALDCSEAFKVIITNNRTEGSAKPVGGGEDNMLHAYVSGQVDEKYGMLTWDKDGTKWHTLEAPGDTNVSVHEVITPPGEATLAKPIGNGNIEYCMPRNVISGRIYIVEGLLEFKTFLSPDQKTLVDEPSAVANGTDAYGKRWSFLEFTYEEDHIVVNLSFVDWVSLALGFTLTTGPQATETSENAPEETHDVPGLVPESLEKICQELKNQSTSDQMPWGELCVHQENSNELLRVLSPNQYATLHLDAWKGYYDAYWEAFGNQTRERGFTINTQDKEGKKVPQGDTITCKMPGNSLLCNSTAEPPVDFEIGPPQHITEIWGCNGGMFNTSKYLDTTPEQHTRYLEILPRLCAAMVRSTLLLDGGHVQPNADIQPAKYYQPNVSGNTKWPTNHYSRIVHQFLRNDKGYAFAYDDVGPDGVDSAGLIDTYYPRIWNITLSK